MYNEVEDFSRGILAVNASWQKYLYCFIAITDNFYCGMDSCEFFLVQKLFLG